MNLKKHAYQVEYGNYKSHLNGSGIYVSDQHKTINETVSSIKYKMACTPIEDSDQPAHLTV